MTEQVYAVRISEKFTRQSEAAFDWLEARADADMATDWLNGLQEAKASLATLPQRCAAADENKAYQKKHRGHVLRILLFRHGRNTWRILFTIHEAADDPAHVMLHQLRHGAQKPLTKWSDEE